MYREPGSLTTMSSVLIGSTRPAWRWRIASIAARADVASGRVGSYRKVSGPETLFATTRGVLPVRSRFMASSSETTRSCTPCFFSERALAS